jgi:hypothetical protein
MARGVSCCFGSGFDRFPKRDLALKCLLNVFRAGNGTFGDERETAKGWFSAQRFSDAKAG